MHWDPHILPKVFACLYFIFLTEVTYLGFLKDHWLFFFFPKAFPYVILPLNNETGIQEERRRENIFQEGKYLQSNITTMNLRPFNSPHLLPLRCSFLQGGEFGQITGFQKISCYTNDSKISSNSRSDVCVSWDITEMLFRCCFPEIKMNKSTEKIAVRPESEGQKHPDTEDSIQHQTTVSDVVPSQQHRRVNRLLLFNLFSENCFPPQLL